MSLSIGHLCVEWYVSIGFPSDTRLSAWAAQQVMRGDTRGVRTYVGRAGIAIAVGIAVGGGVWIALCSFVACTTTVADIDGCHDGHRSHLGSSSAGGEATLLSLSGWSGRVGGREGGDRGRGGETRLCASRKVKPYCRRHHATVLLYLRAHRHVQHPWIDCAGT